MAKKKPIADEDPEDDALPDVEDAADGLVPDDDPEDAAPPPPERTHFREYLAGKGYKLEEDYTDEQLYGDMEQMVAERQRLIDERNAAAPQLREWQQQRGEFERWRAEQAKKQEPETPAEKPVWQPPKWDTAWEGRVKYDPEKRRYVPATEYDSPQVAEDYARRRKWEEETLRRLLDDPVGVWTEAGGKQALASLREEIKKEILSEVQSSTSAVRTDDALSNFFDRNYHLFWQTDEQGQIMVDARNQPQPTPAGTAYFEAAKAAREMFGLGTNQDGSMEKAPPQIAERIHRFAMQAAAKNADSNGRSAKNGKKAGAEKKRKFIDRHRKPADRDDVDATLHRGRQNTELADWNELVAQTEEEMA